MARARRQPRCGEHGQVAEHDHGVLDEHAVRVLVERRHLAHLPAAVGERRHVPMPLPQCQLRIDRPAFEVGERPRAAEPSHAMASASPGADATNPS
jgi:hypothetical protein